MIKDDSIYIDHILDCIMNIQKFVRNKTVDEYANDELLQSALIRQIEVIGEATKRVSNQLRAKNPNIPWKDMAGMRDKLIHDYFDVDLNVVWKTVQDDIPELYILFQKIKY